MALVSIMAERVRVLAGGVREIEVSADTVGRLIAELDRRWPGLGEFVEEHVAIAIDGEIHQDAFAEPIGPRSEVVLIPRIGGG